MKMRIAVVLLALIALIVIGTLSFRPDQLVASPNSTLRIIDEEKRPMTGVRIVRVWRTSEEQSGKDESVTDSKGGVSFKKVTFSMSRLKRLTKPLLIFVPAACGPDWEIFGQSEFQIYCRKGLAPKFDEAEWKKVNEVYKNSDDVCIRDPELSKLSGDEDVELYFFNKQADFDYTLTLFRQPNSSFTPTR